MVTTPPSSAPEPVRLFSRSSWSETRVVLDVLRAETVGGLLLLGAAVVALVWANSPWAGAYSGTRDAVLGPDVLTLGPLGAAPRA